VSSLQNCVFEFCCIYHELSLLDGKTLMGLYYQIIDANVIVLVVVRTIIIIISIDM